ncbi:MAG: extracellular solute-binding protein [Corallococcus sp.]|nr:extracellular solute-binding protein [Corallococcus sp.]MCM1360138.1 extracellular solute-binding protein [Corallococcus sp.]MCM1395474.1 extracellular solute-binding protein [Corallococcus sp.]
MKNKKIVSLLLAVVMVTAVVCVLAACGPTEDPNTINFLAYAPANEQAKTIYNNILKAFTEETGINVKPVYVPKDNYNTKLSGNFKSNSKPDVFYLDQPMLADYADFCLDLDEAKFFADESATEGLKKSDFFASAMDTAVYKNKCYAVPLSLTTSVLLYNKSLVTDVPANWDEWKSMSVTSGKALFGGISSGGYASWYFQAFLKSAGGEMVSGSQPVFNNTEAQTAVQMIVDLYAKSPKTVRESSNAFTNGNVMFVLAHSSDIVNNYASNPTWCASNMAATKFIPQTTGATSYSNIGGENLAIRKDSGKEDACKKLVEWLLKEENVTKIIGQNFSAIKDYAKVPTNNPITGEAYSQVVKDALAVVLEQLETASARPAVKGWTKVNDIYLADALADVLDNDANIKSALDTAVNQAKSVLEF